MNNIVREIVFAVADENLLPKDTECPVRLAYSPSSQSSDVRTRLWLGEIHGRRPFTAHKLRDVFIFQRLIGSTRKSLHTERRQLRAKAEGLVRRNEHFLKSSTDQVRQALAAILC
ncbi:hypothetical protein D3C84_821310 [compost metagenome]